MQGFLPGAGPFDADDSAGATVVAGRSPLFDDLDDGPFGAPARRVEPAAAPAGPLREAHSGAAKVVPRGPDFVDFAFDAAAINPLVGAGQALVWVAARLNDSLPPDDVATFRDRVLEQIRVFESAAMARGYPQQTIRVARYALGATIDDIVLNTEWGQQSDWPARGVISILYNETWGGERFYDLLDQLLLRPDEHVEVLELMSICLAIGFAGKYRVLDAGQSRLAKVRQDLYRVLRRIRGPYERELSPDWRGVAVPQQMPPSGTLAPVVSLGAVVVCGALYLYWSLSLTSAVETARSRLAQLVPTVETRFERPVFTPPAAPPAAPLTQTQRIAAPLKADIDARRVEVASVGDSVAVRLLRAGFQPGGTALAAAEQGLIERIAKALDPEAGRITVVGHTDNVPFAPRPGLRDNQDLWEARARSVADALGRSLKDRTRVVAEGRGDSEPIAGNDTPEGRARNRRVEIRLPAERAP